MSRRVRTAHWIGGAGATALLVLVSWLARPELIEREPQPTHVEPTPELVAKGEYLARAGNCVGCHTAPGESPYAGGRRIDTPFGAIYSTNLTPDDETGIGAWTTADFWRALHYGKSRDGRRLYPAFPYDSYTRITREDSDAIFAFLTSLEPVSSARIEPTLRFPYNTQLALMVWRALYFRPGKFEPDPERSAEWNRGAYLVEGLGHCGACHTPRTGLGGSDLTAKFAGGSVPGTGWDAPPLAPATPLSDADAHELAQVLHAGTARRSVASGPMAEVVYQSLQYLTRDDIDAMVTYLRTLPAAPRLGRRLGPPVGREQAAHLAARGAVVYRERCAECHGDDGAGEPYVYPALAGNPLVTAPSARNVLHTVLLGGYAPSTMRHPRPYGMPPYAHQLSSEDIAAVLTYVRSAWGNAAPAVAPATVERR